MERMRKNSRIVIQALIILLGFTACDRESDEPGTEVSNVIGSSGGIIEVTDQSSRLYGVKVEIPSGVLSKANNIRVSIDDRGLSIPEGVQILSEIVAFTADDSIFKGFVKISIPCKDNGINEELLRVFRWDETTSTWDVTLFDKTDKQANIITIAADHFSSYAVLYTSIVSEKALDFSPSADGFFVKNQYDLSYGMAAFSKWFWETKKSEEGRLWGWMLNAQYGIAAKATYLTLLNYYNLVRNLPDIPVNSDYNTAVGVVQGLLVNEKPKMLILKYPSGTGTTYRFHTVLAISFKQIENSTFIFGIYDPDFPQEIRNLTFDGTKFLDYLINSNNSVIAAKIFLVPGESNNKPMEDVFRSYESGFLPFTYYQNPGNDNIKVEGVMGKSRSVSKGAEFEIFGTYDLNSTGTAAIVPHNYGSSTCNYMGVDSEPGYFSVSLKVNEVSPGWGDRINISFFPLGANQFVGDGFGGGYLIITQ